MLLANRAEPGRKGAQRTDHWRCSFAVDLKLYRRFLQLTPSPRHVIFGMAPDSRKKLERASGAVVQYVGQATSGLSRDPG